MVDLNYLKSSFPNDGTIVENIIDIFLIEYPDFVLQLEEGMRQHNIQKLVALGHRWKYTSKILGIVPLTDNLNKLEACEKHEQAEVEKLSAKLLQQMREVFLELKNYEIA